MPAVSSQQQLQVPLGTTDAGHRVQHFDLSRDDDILVEFHDQSPTFGLQLHEPVQSSVDKQNFGKAVRFENPMF